MYSLVISNIILDINLDPLESITVLGELVAEKSILVASAVILLFSWLSMFLYVFRKSKGQEDIRRVVEDIKHIQDQLERIVSLESDESLREQTRWNAEKILRALFSENLQKLLNGTNDIILQNHIADRDYTAKRVEALVKSAHIERVKQLNSFTYNKIPLGEYANSETWINRKVDILIEYIYSEDRKETRLRRSLVEAYTEFNNELKL